MVVHTVASTPRLVTLPVGSGHLGAPAPAVEGLARTTRTRLRYRVRNEVLLVEALQVRCSDFL